MKTIPPLMWGILLTSATATCVAQPPGTASLGRNGELVCTNLSPNTTAAVEWSSSVDGPWTSTWAALDAVPVGPTGTIRLSVPMFYRVRVGQAMTAIAKPDASTAAPTPEKVTVKIAYAANGQLECEMLEPGSTATAQWGPSLWGPWNSSWAGLESVVADSSGTIRVAVPIYYRLKGIPLTSGQPGLVWIPPGTFIMGSPATEVLRGNNEGPQTEVTVSQGFWMGKYEVTQAEYLDVVGVNPSHFAGDLNRPVEMVSWIDATNYCALLTARERLAGRLPEGYFYRLPTEAEWEYACRAGTTTAFHYGDELHSGMANFAGIWGYDAAVGYVPDAEGIFLERTTPVGSYEPNGWGLYDVVGNVWEWCWDSYRDSLPGRSVFDPRIGPTGPDRIYRGGAWGSTGVGCRSAARGQFRATILLEEMGFRVVLAGLR